MAFACNSAFMELRDSTYPKTQAYSFGGTNFFPNLDTVNDSGGEPGVLAFDAVNSQIQLLVPAILMVFSFFCSLDPVPTSGDIWMDAVAFGASPNTGGSQRQFFNVGRGLFYYTDTVIVGPQPLVDEWSTRINLAAVNPAAGNITIDSVSFKVQVLI